MRRRCRPSREHNDAEQWNFVGPAIIDMDQRRHDHVSRSRPRPLAPHGRTMHSRRRRHLEGRPVIPVHPKRTVSSPGELGRMSASGHLQTSPSHRKWVCSTAETGQVGIRLRCLPGARSRHRGSFDHLIGASEHCGRHLESNCAGGLQIDDQREFLILLDGQFCRIGSP